MRRVRECLALAVALAAGAVRRAAGCELPRSSVKDKLDGADIAFVGPVTALQPVATSGGIALTTTVSTSTIPSRATSADR